MAVLKLADQPPLVQAIFSGDPEEIRMLIYKTEDVNALDAEKRTPLHVASFLGDADIIELLILSGRMKGGSFEYYSFTSFLSRRRMKLCMIDTVMDVQDCQGKYKFHCHLCWCLYSSWAFSWCPRA